MSEESPRQEAKRRVSTDRVEPAAGARLAPPSKSPNVESTARTAPAASEALCRHFQAFVEQLGAEMASGAHATLSVGLTSSQRREGVSSMAAGLAVTAAIRGLCPVLLVDANLTRPAQDQIFQTPRAPGLAEYLLEGLEPEAVKHSTNIHGLSVVGVGSVPRDPTVLWEALRKVDWQRELSEGNTLVVVDLPALSADGLSASFASRLDGTLLVVESERSQRDGAEAARRLLAAANAQLWGVVFNKYRRRAPRWLERRDGLV